MARRKAMRLDGEGDAALADLDLADLRARWRAATGREAPAAYGRDLLLRALLHRRAGGLDRATAALLDRLLEAEDPGALLPDRVPSGPKPGTVFLRAWGGVTHTVTATGSGYLWNGATHPSLSAVARRITGVAWNGPRFFGLRTKPQGGGEGGRAGWRPDRARRSKADGRAAPRCRIATSPPDDRP
jgi:hypothetical protein